MRVGCSVAVLVAAMCVASCGFEPATSEQSTATYRQPAAALVVAEPSTTSSSAVATAPVEWLPTDPSTPCERIAVAVAVNRPAVDTQIVARTVSDTDTVATLEIARRTSIGWRCEAPMSAMVGRSGVRPLLQRRSGDGTTPAGVFGLGTMTAPDGQQFSFFGNSPDPGVTAGNYRAVQRGDCFGATIGTAGYGHLRHDTACSGVDDEYLPNYVKTYSNAALIGANMEPNVSGDQAGETPYAAAIFLHHHAFANGAPKPTSGCVSLTQIDLTEVLLAITPNTLFVIGSTDWLLSQPS